ncbi:acyltransferase [Flavobacteriales bacterium]|nr:acyltransferase [Flavobacteriales bacterium]
MNRINGLDGIRAFAVSMVVISHFFEGSTNIRNLHLGHWGVMIFFVLSGFLVSRILFKKETTSKKTALKNFFVRRALRIFPLYFLSILVFSQIGIAFGPELLYHLTYTTNFYILNHRGFLAPHFWSLAVEEQFYLILPFILLFLTQKAIPTAILFLFSTGVFFRSHYFLADMGTHDRLLWSNLDALGLGIILATHENNGISTLQLFAITLMPIGISTLLGSSFLMVHYVILASTLFTILAICNYQTSSSVRILEYKPLKYIGVISYGIYVWHYLLWQNKDLFFPLTQALNQIHPIMEFGHGNAIVIGTTTLFFSAASYELYEKRILKLKRHFH